jgi:hypothetical protein
LDRQRLHGGLATQSMAVDLQAENLPEGVRTFLFNDYDKTEACDGHASLEGNPHLAHDTKGTVGRAALLANGLGFQSLGVEDF